MAELSDGAPLMPAVGIPPPRVTANIFYSGHSLMDRPLPDFVQGIAESLKYANQWNRQYVVGSSLERRTRGAASEGEEWIGYKQGENRNGAGLDVLAELRQPETIEGRYDVLVVTEEHTMMEKVVSGDTVRYLQHYHDKFIAANPQGTTYFYEPWFSVEDKSDPSRWIQYERAASPVWQCVATRINASLEAQGRKDRVISLPAGAALAELIDVATRRSGLPSITRSNTLETVDSVFRDGVHLTPLGAYYTSLVTYAAVYGQSPKGAWFPEDVTPQQAAALQEVAWTFVSRYYENYRPLTLEQCRSQLLTNDRQAFYWSYIRDAYWRKELGVVRGYLRYVRRLLESRRTLGQSAPGNPFFFDSASERN